MGWEILALRAECARLTEQVRVMRALSGERVEYVPTYTSSDTAPPVPAVAVTEAMGSVVCEARDIFNDLDESELDRQPTVIKRLWYAVRDLMRAEAAALRGPEASNG